MLVLVEQKEEVLKDIVELQIEQEKCYKNDKYKIIDSFFIF